jgi:hypothetical protein
MPMKRLLSGLALAVVALGFTAGCSTTSDGVSAKAAKDLRGDVEAVRVAASGSSVSAVSGAVQALVNEVNSLEQSGNLSDVRGRDIQDAAQGLLTDFKQRHKPTPPPTTPSTTPATSPSETPTTPTPTVTVTVPATPTDTTTPPVIPTHTNKHGKPPGPP